MSTIKERYFDILTRGANLTELCDLTAEYVKNPVAITLTTRTIIAKSHDYTPELVTEYTSSLEQATPEELKEMFEKMDELLYMGKPILRLWPYVRHKRVNCGCFHRNNMIAVIDCPVIEKSFDEAAFSVIELAASIFVIALGMNSYITLDTVYPMQNYLIGLLKRDINEHYQQRNLYNSVLETVEAFKVIWVKPKNQNLPNQIKTTIITFCERQKNWWSIDFDDGFVILIDAIQEAGIEQLGEVCSGLCSFCVSDTFHELKKVGVQLDLAQTALRLSAFEDNDSTIVFVDQYKSPIAFLYSYQNSGLEVFENLKINEIKKYDKENSSDYMNTLRAYLLCNRDHNRMAEKMHIHRNTVFYRMKRIAELFDIDLSDCRMITGLYLSLFIESKKNNNELAKI